MSESFNRREKNSSSSTAVAKKPIRKKIADKFNVTESFRIHIQNSIDEFIEEPEQLTMKFPAALTNIERGYIHTMIQKLGLKSKSHGSGSSRQLMIYKPNSNSLIDMDATFQLHTESNKLALNYLHKNPLNQIDLGKLNKYCDSTIKKNVKSMFNCSFGNSQYLITVPPISSIFQRSQQDPVTIGIQQQRQQLPIYDHRSEIIKTIETNQVTVISGDTGSGKTTQVPQYLLEEYCASNKKCRIICIQPRRLAAISIADRVAWERGEQVGLTIAYQIRLESRITLTSNLIYTTSGFFLRCLVSDQSAQFQSVTHIILDEVHERDRFTDFLLIAIKNELTRNKQLKVILMSATLDSNVFCNYFGGCPLINIPGRMFPVNVYHLEETLAIVGFLDHMKSVQDYRQQNRVNQEQPQAVTVQQNPLDYNSILNEETIELDVVDREHIDEILHLSFVKEDIQLMDQFYYLSTGEGVPIDYRHSETQMTALMIAAYRGWLSAIDNLKALGANPFLEVNKITAKMWAASEKHKSCYEYLEKYEMEYLTNKLRIHHPNDSITSNIGAGGINDINEQEFLLKTYMSKTNEVDIDYKLVFSIIKNIHMSEPLNGCILVFLPGYDTIVELNDTILSNQSTGEISSNLQILMLHGSMQAIDQKQVFLPPPFGYRKLILSTNIAETSLTIDDVVYVIDCGKVKQNTYDAVSGATSLTTTWISRACSKQRMGRAGRVQSGICYRLYSKLRHQNMDEYTLPEILRIPLTEISLNAKMLAGANIGIAEFLAQAIQSPPSVSVKQSIELLKTIGALDINEDITQLGIHLIDLPVECQLGKTLIYAVLMKCIDPVLTIVSALSQKDPFVVGSLNQQQNNDTIDNNDRFPVRGGGGFNSKNKSREPACRATVQTLSDKSFSDHLVLLRVYQKWCDAKANNKERDFCQDNFISNGSMQMICGIRSQILGHMRSVGFIQHKSQGNIHDLNKNSSNWSVVKGCFVAGMYPNICRIDRKQGNIKSRYENKLIPHASSVLRDKNPKMCQATMCSMMTEWILFGEKSRVGRLCLIRCNTVITPFSVALFSGPMNMTPDKLINVNDDSSDEDDDDDEEDDGGGGGGSGNLTKNNTTTRYQIDDWLSFLLDTDTAYTVHNLRQKLNSYLVRIIEDPKKYHKEQNSDLIQTISDMLYKEDILVGLPQPKEVGRRPISVNLKLAPDMNSGRPETHRFGQSSSSSEMGRQIDSTNKIILPPQLQKERKKQPWKGKK